MEKLAMLGGPPTKQTPYGTGNRFCGNELKYLREALEQNTLFYWMGTKVKTLSARFAEMYGVSGCVATSSGTAAIHVALGAAGIGPGDEVITAPITDAGTLVGILFQNAVPVFADLDPRTYTMTASEIEKKITPRTKAILVVHLTGNAVDMDPVMELAHRHKLTVIEDCAQSFMTTYKGRLVGTIGHVGCFSLNDYKQISAGDGGLVITHDEALLERAARFADKNYQRGIVKGASVTNSAIRDVPYLAPNYRMNELTGAVGLAQLERLAAICDKRHAFGQQLTQGLAGLPGILPPQTTPQSRHSYWFYLLRIDPALAGADRNAYAEALKAEGILCEKGYIDRCVYEYEMLTRPNVYNGTQCPFCCPLYTGTPAYHKGLCPIAEDILATSLKLPVTEFYTQQDAQDIIGAFRKVNAWFTGNKG